MFHVKSDIDTTYSSCPVLCILAHNEEANIANTLMSIIHGNHNVKFLLKVYANGCTDNTHQIVNSISNYYSFVELIKIKHASKSNAWNIAFNQNKNEVLLFADGDVEIEPGAIRNILDIINSYKEIDLACCQAWPDSKHLGWQQKFTGFMLIPLIQDFLKGGFYGIRRSSFAQHFQRLGLHGLPEGIVGDDAFLDNLVTRDRFVCINSKVIFKPPNLSDYYRFRARMKWQDEQMLLYFGKNNLVDHTLINNSLLQKIKRKAYGSKNPIRFMLGGAAAITRVIFMTLLKYKIEKEYNKLGPVTSDGGHILSDATRSTSTK